MTAALRLLAATDLAAPARHAAEHAAPIAREPGGELDLLHVISASPVVRLRRLPVEAPADLEARVTADVLGDVERLGEVLLGSVTRHVLQESQGDVLVSLAPPLLDGGVG
jgi:nucleotide-binding universal stress UspA family protein